MIYDWYRRFAGKDKQKESKASAPGKSGQNDSDFSDLDVMFSNREGQKITSSYIKNAIDCADEGNPQDQVDLYNMIIDKEPHIIAHVQTRILAIMGVEWKIANEKGDADEDTQKMLKKAGIRKAMKHILSAFYYGYSGVVNNWESGGSEIKSFSHILPYNFVFDMAGNPGIVRENGEEQAIADYTPGQFMTHYFTFRPGIPCQGGLLRALVWLYFYKHYGLRHKAKFLERFGNPFLVAKLTDTDYQDKDTLSQTLRMLKNIGLSGMGAIKKNSELETIQNNVSASSDAYDGWFKYIDETFAVLILGQTATMGTASGMSNGTLQGDVRKDILESDCEDLMDTINSQLVNFLYQFKTGKSGDYQFKLEFEEGEDLNEKAKMIETLQKAGHTVTDEWVEKTFNVPLVKKEEIKTQNNDAGKTQAFSEKPQIIDSRVARDEYVDRLTNNTLEKLFVSTEAMSEFYKPLRVEIRKIFKGVDPDNENILGVFAEKAEELFKKYPAMYDTMNTESFENILSGASLAAMIKGNV